jgi:myo-inositol-1(or 4)-monophosphatase
MSDASVNVASLAEIAATIAKHVGLHIRHLREAGAAVAETKSSRTDIVTAADREAEQMIVAQLRQARPTDGLLGEEGASIPSQSGISWVIDPIDGTVNYLYGLPGYAVSIAATVEDDGPSATADGRRAVAGAVYVPSSDELFTASEGGGSQLNGQPIRTSDESELSLALVATGFGYTVERRTEQAEVVRQLIPKVRDIRRLGAAATDLCLLAAGRLDAYYERGLQPWDYAAGVLIAREAGAEVLGRDDHRLPGEPLMIAGPPGVARKLQAAVRDAYATLR